MIARLGRFWARWAAARARATVDADGFASSEKPPPSTTATSGNPARSPSSVVMRVLELVEAAVHQLDDSEVVTTALVVDRVTVGFPPGNPRLVVDRIVVEALVDRDAREKLVERDRDLCDRILLLRGVEPGDRVIEDRIEVDRPARVGLRERVLHATAGRVLVELAERPHQRCLRMRVTDAPRPEGDLELTRVVVG